MTYTLIYHNMCSAIFTPNWALVILKIGESPSQPISAHCSPLKVSAHSPFFSAAVAVPYYVLFDAIFLVLAHLERQLSLISFSSSDLQGSSCSLTWQSRFEIWGPQKLQKKNGYAKWRVKPWNGERRMKEKGSIKGEGDFESRGSSRLVLFFLLFPLYFRNDSPKVLGFIFIWVFCKSRMRMIG